MDHLFDQIEHRLDAVADTLAEITGARTISARKPLREACKLMVANKLVDDGFPAEPGRVIKWCRKYLSRYEVEAIRERLSRDL